VSASPIGNQIGFYSNTNSAWVALSGSFTLTTMQPANPSSLILRFQSSTLFTGTAGSVGNLYFGSSAFIALDAEL
jgi:hypothetical protein